MNALKAYNTEAIDRFHQQNVNNTEVVKIPQDPDNGPSDLPESDLHIPNDPILNFVKMSVSQL